LTRRILPLLLLLVLGAGAVVLYQRTRDERQIHRALRDLLALCEKREASGLLATALRAQDLLGAFTSNAVVRVGPPYPMTLTRGDLPPLLARAHQYADRLTVRSRGDELTIEGDRRQALMRVTLDIEVVIDGQTDFGIGEYEFAWRKEERRWRIAAVNHMETIRHPSRMPEP
jgi:hypothetical protein